MKEQRADRFIAEHKNSSLAEVALLLSSKPELPGDYIIRQINGLQKTPGKLPRWSRTKGLKYPPPLSLEQCSSERTARYKAGLYGGDTMIDLTGGFGVDTFYMSPSFRKAIHVEPNKQLQQIAAYNFKLMNNENTVFINSTAEEFIKKHREKAGLIYIDPSRRKDSQKLYKLEDTLPDVTSMMPEFFGISPKIMIKTSPLLDIKSTVKKLPGIEEVHVVAVENECREVLYLLDRSAPGKILIKAVNLNEAKADELLEGHFTEEKSAESEYGNPETYLYEPNSAVMKSGMFNILSKRFQLKKLNPNTHIYTSERLQDDFPGKKFRLLKIIPYKRKEFNREVPKKNGLSVTSRNFPDSVQEILNKLKRKEGSETRVLAVRNRENRPVLLLCEPL